MSTVHYTATVKAGRLIELPEEAQALHLKPGQKIEVEIGRAEAGGPVGDDDPTLVLLDAWLAQAPTDPDEIREAEEDLREFQRNMNQSRKEGGMRILYPEVE